MRRAHGGRPISTRRRARARRLWERHVFREMGRMYGRIEWDPLPETPVLYRIPLFITPKHGFVLGGARLAEPFWTTQQAHYEEVLPDA